MHHFVTEMCTHTCGHFCFKMVHCGIWYWFIVGYGTGALWDLWDWSISLTQIRLWMLNCTNTPYQKCIISPWWRHQMEIFSALLTLCAGNSPVPVNSPHKGQWLGALMFSLICAWIYDWVNDRETGDLRRHRGHYDVNVMCNLCKLIKYIHMKYFLMKTISQIFSGYI